MRWIFKEPSLWAIVFASLISGATFLYGRAGVSTMFQNLHLWFPAYAEVAGILSLVFAFLALVALVLFFITLYKKMKEGSNSKKPEELDVKAISSDIKAIKELLGTSKIIRFQDKNSKDKKRGNNQD